MPFVPYPELRFETPSEDRLVLSTPWFRMTLEAEPWVTALVRAKDFSDPAMQRFFEKLLPYPLAYALEDAHGDPTDFPWDLREVSALSAYTVLRRERFLHLTQRVRADGLYARLASFLDQDPSDLRSVALLLRQNHFVTRACDASLAPAERIAGPAGSLIRDFRNSEKNHDKLLAQSLAALGFLDPETLSVFESTRSMMATLREAAETDAFAFAVLVEAFEGGIRKTGSGILADLLERNPATRAAALGLRKHHTINETAHHAQIGLEIAKLLPAVSAERFASARASLEHLMNAQAFLVQESKALF